MKKVVIILLVVLVLLAGFGVFCYYYYEMRDIDVLGHTVPVNTQEITFTGEEIPNAEALATSLAQLRKLEKADLGNFHMFKDEAASLQEALPGVTFVYTPYVSVAGTTYLETEEALNLEGVDYDLDTLETEMRELVNLKHVDFGAEPQHADTLAKLRADFPNVEFSAIALYTLAGQDYREDITELDLSGGPVAASLEEELGQFPKLELVNLHDTGIDSERYIALRKAFPNIRFQSEFQLDGETFSTEVEEIDFNSRQIGDYETFLKELALFDNLSKVELCDSGLTNEQMERLCNTYPNTKFVWRLHLGQWSLRTDAVAFSVLIVNYRHKRLQTKDIEVLKYCTDLQALDLGHQALTDLSVIGDYLPELRILILADNAITDLTPLSKLKHLHYLEFFVNRVKDLTPLAACREMVDLNISYNYNISDITPLLDLPLLERLWLESVAVSPQDVQLLRDTYPNAKIVSVGSGSVDQGWRTHDRYFAMIDMYYKKDYISELFSMYDNKAA